MKSYDPSLNIEEFNLLTWDVWEKLVISDRELPFTKSSRTGSLEITIWGLFKIFCSFGINLEYHPFPLKYKTVVLKFLLPYGVLRWMGI